MYVNKAPRGSAKTRFEVNGRRRRVLFNVKCACARAYRYANEIKNESVGKYWYFFYFFPLRYVRCRYGQVRCKRPQKMSKVFSVRLVRFDLNKRDPSVCELFFTFSLLSYTEGGGYFPSYIVFKRFSRSFDLDKIEVFFVGNHFVYAYITETSKYTNFEKKKIQIRTFKKLKYY